MIPVINDRQFVRDMSNIVKYAEGFLDGVHHGKPRLMVNVAENLKEIVADYIDASARVNPAQLHHVYEWYSTGSPAARLYDINYVIRGDSLSMSATFRQSNVAKGDSKTPFRNKAYVMENGISVTIRPKNSEVLVFKDGEETVFTKKPVNVVDPGGQATTGAFEGTFKQFFSSYLSQSLLLTSGLFRHLQNPTDFKRGLKSGARGGRSAGFAVGMNWVSRGVQ